MPALDLMFRFLGVDAGASREFRKMSRESAAASAALHRLAAGAVMVGGVVAAAGVKMAADYQAELRHIQTQAGASQRELNRLGAGILHLAGQVGEAPKEMAEAAYHLESQGLRGAKALQALRTAAEGAKMGGADLVDVTNALGATIVSGMRGVRDYTKAMGALNATVGGGDMTMQNLAEAMGTGVLAVIKGFGVNIREAGAALATFGDNNIRGAAAGTQLRMAVLALAHPIASASDALHKLGLSGKNAFDYFSGVMQKRGLAGALEDLHNRVEKVKASGEGIGKVLEDAFGRKAGTGLNILMDQYSRFKTKLDEVKTGATGFGKSWSKYSQTAQASFDRLKSSGQALLIQIGNALLPTATKFANWLNDKLVPALRTAGGWVRRNKEWLAPLVVTLGTAATAILTVVRVTQMWKAAQLALKGTMVANPVGAAVVAVAALAAGLIYAYKHSETFRRVVQAAFHGVVDAAKAVAGFFTGPFIHGIGVMVSYFVRGVKFLADVWMTEVGLILHGAAKAFGWVPGVGGKLKQAAAAFDDFRAAVDRKLSGIAAAASRWGTNAGRQIGASLGAGLVAGLESQMPHATVAGKLAVQQVAKNMRIAAQIHSPSRLTMRVGQAMADGLAVGLTRGRSYTLATRTVARLLAEGLINGWTGMAGRLRNILGTQVENALNALTSRVLHAVDRQRGLLKAAQQKLRQDMASMRGDVTSLAGQLTPSVGGVIQQNAVGQDVVATPVAAYLQTQAAQLQRFARDLGLLRKRGLPAGLLSDIAGLGPSQGVLVAEQILQSGVGVVSAAYRQVAAYAQQAASTVEGAVYAPRLAADRRDVHEQTVTLHRIERSLRRQERVAARTVAQHITVEVTGHGLKLTREDARVIASALRRAGAVGAA